MLRHLSTPSIRGKGRWGVGVRLQLAFTPARHFLVLGTSPSSSLIHPCAPTQADIVAIDEDGDGNIDTAELLKFYGADIDANGDGGVSVGGQHKGCGGA